MLGGGAATQNGTMNTTQPRPNFEHPSLNLLVTDAQRDRAVGYLQEAYADGRLDEAEFDQRVEHALSARTRRDLNSVFNGLVRVTPTQQALAAHPAYLPVLNQNSDGVTGRVAGGLAHFSSIPAPLIGPGIFYAVSAKNSYARSQAAKAFNFQLTALIIAAVIGIATGIVSGILPGSPEFGWINGLWTMAWFVLTVVGGVKALGGENWRNPVMARTGLHVLDERTQPGIRR